MLSSPLEIDVLMFQCKMSRLPEELVKTHVCIVFPVPKTNVRTPRDHTIIAYCVNVSFRKMRTIGVPFNCK